uniref:Uncharacterized protein n=1 Tax=Globisporangium ultimum (strain ATCC 200006 / CBS 805.95 / DAOM BR144) TaxID=431595 RepID=K3WLD9_GLOUD
MPTSPDRRVIQSRAVKKLSAGSTLSKSTSESSLSKTKQGSLLEQELLSLERDEGKRHARELSACLLEYAKKIDNLQEKNRRLEEELSFDDHVTRDDPFFNDQVAEKLSNLYLQGNNFMIRLELERKEITRLNALIQRHESILAQQKSKLYELVALDHNHNTLIGRIRKMENDIDRRIVKMNERLNINRKLRETIDAHRADRARMDAIYTKISSETLAKRHKIARASNESEKLRQEVADIEQQIEDIRQEGEEWEMKCDQKAALLLQELKEIALHQKDVEEMVDVDKHKYLGENDIMRSIGAAQENMLRSRVTHSRWKTGQAKIATDVLLTKYQENRTIIEKIHEVSGTKTVSEMIEAFNNQYPFPTNVNTHLHYGHCMSERHNVINVALTLLVVGVLTEIEHFDRIQHVNQLAEDIENHRQVSSKLREEIGKLKQRKDSVEFQRMNRIEGFKSRLQLTIDQKKHKEEANHNLQSFLAALRPSILLLHSRIGCPELHNDSDMKKVLGEIEEQVVAILQKYHLKSEAKKMDDASKDSNSPSSPGVTSARSASQAGKARAEISGTPQTAPHGTASARVDTSQSSLPGAAQLGTERSGSTNLGSPSVPADSQKVLNFKTISALVSKDQPYRYGGLRPPHLSMEELKKKDNVEEEYPLTYDELKVKVWHHDTTQ